MLHTTLLTLHSVFRWILLVALLYSLYRSYRGWFSGLNFGVSDLKTNRITTITAHIQLLIGLILYAVSPVIHRLFGNFGEAVQQSSVRFYGMEHSVMMIIAIILITIGSVRSRKKKEDLAKFKTAAIWFTIALFIILITTPWPFSPFDARPWFRIF